MSIKVYTDGACSGNPGIGGYGCLIKYIDKEIEFSGYEPDTTNNRMELLGAIIALESIKSHSQVIEVMSDSQYLIKGMNSWLKGWIQNGWRNSKREPTPNKDLWLRLIDVNNKHRITWTWIKGHAGHIENEHCDKLAKGAINNGTTNRRTNLLCN